MQVINFFKKNGGREHARDDDASLPHSSIQCYTHPMTAPKPIPGFDIGAENVPTPSKPARTPKSRDETITLRGVAVPLNSAVGGAFISDCARNRERLFSDDRLREKYEINSDADWTEIIKNKPLRLAINAECERRMLNGDAAREAAAKQFTKAPEILGGILENERASPRHRIEAAKELRATAHSGDEKPGADAERVIVTINLGNAPEDKLVFDCGVPKQTQEALDAEKES